MGEDAAVTAGVVFLGDGLTEELIELGDAVAQEVLKADDHGRLETLGHSLIDHVHNADGAGVGLRINFDGPVGADAKMAGAPAFKTIKFFGATGTPRSGGGLFQRRLGFGFVGLLFED